MKKIAALLLTLSVLLSLAACGMGGGKAPDPDGKNDGIENAAADSARGGIAVGNYTIELDEPLKHGDMCFSAPKNAEKSGYDKIFSFFCRVDEGMLFSVSIIYFEGKGVDEALEGTAEEMTDKTVGGLTYRYFESTGNDGASHVYVTCFEGDTYAVTFSSDQDTAALEEAFLSGVRFEKA
ncbi:MAG: hypothetical protein II776_02020 [Clostridia bacterium]|nr:hypothetical protein [Clostridia bacterium]